MPIYYSPNGMLSICRVFVHYKGFRYARISDSILPASGDPVVVYRSLYYPRSLWCRPSHQFYDPLRFIRQEEFVTETVDLTREQVTHSETGVVYPAKALL